MSPKVPSLDLTRLEKVRYHASGKIEARCPACAEEGSDRTGNHLAIFPDGCFACAAFPGDRDHRRRIFALAGLAPDQAPHPAASREWIEQRNHERRQEQQRQRLQLAARTNRRAVIERHPWTPADAWHDSPQRIDNDSVAADPPHFLASLFPTAAVIWTGGKFDSGKPRHSARWKSCDDWSQTSEPIGPMTTPAVWKPNTFSRTAGNVASAPYTVLDFDGFDGIKPSTPEEVRRHLLDSLALIRWLREDRAWQLAAILWTGGKGLHAWFHTPPPEALQSLVAVAVPLGLDAGLIGRPEHPCRLPGQRHEKTGKSSLVLWLKTNPPFMP